MQLFPKAVNRVKEHFRGKGTLKGVAQPPCSRQGQLGGSGWITQCFGFESKPLRMEPAQPVWAGCSNVGLSWSQESFSFCAVGTTPVLIYARLSLTPTTPHCEKSGCPQKISLSHPIFPIWFLWRGCVNPLQSSSFPTSCLHPELWFFLFLHIFLISERSSLWAFCLSIFFGYKFVYEFLIQNLKSPVFGYISVLGASGLLHLRWLLTQAVSLKPPGEKNLSF